MAAFDELRHGGHGSGCVVEQGLLLSLGHEPEERTGLGVVVCIIFVKVPVVALSVYRDGRLAEFFLFLPFTEAVGLVVDGGTVVAVRAHLPVLVVGVVGAARAIDGNLHMVDPESVSLGIAIGKETPLQHFVRGESDTGYHMCRIERGLLHIGKEVFRIAVELHFTHLNERKVPMRPDFGEVKGVVGGIARLLLSHDLNTELPAGIFAALNGVEEVARGAVAVFGDDGCCLSVRQVADALLANPVELDPHPLVGGIEHGEGVAAEAVHVAVAIRDAAVAHHDGDLVEGFRQAGPEIPVGGGVGESGAGVAFDGVVQIRELERVAQKKDGGVVANQIPVAFLGIELDGKSAYIPLRIGGAAFARHRGKAHKDGCFLADAVEEGRAGVARDIVRYTEGAEGPGTFGVHAAFRDNFPIEMSDFLQIPHVLHELRSSRSGGEAVVIVCYRSSGSRGQFLVGIHARPIVADAAALDEMLTSRVA